MAGWSGDTPLRSELTRAFTRLFGTRGGFSPTVGREIIPVQIMDIPAWPAGRRWTANIAMGAGAGLNAVAMIGNNDPADSGSLVTVDWARITVGAATDVVWGLAPLGSLGYTIGPFAVPDVAPAPSSPTGGAPKVANVVIGAGSVAFVPTGYSLYGLITAWEAGPAWPGWTIIPQFELRIGAQNLNVALNVTIGGRYYSAL